jgi:hypothetical protein
MIRSRLIALLIAAVGMVGGTATISTAAASAHHGVTLARPGQKVGGRCKNGAAGCSKDGKFTGRFFG